MMSIAASLRRFLAAAAVLVVATPALAAENAVLEVHKVAENVYALVGPLEQRSPANLGNNATFGAVVTDSGVILIDSGGSARGAQAIEAALATVTDRPVSVVINTGGQDHRWFGNAHFEAKGARIIASEAAVADQTERGDGQFAVMRTLTGEDGVAGTKLAYAAETFADALDLTIGGTRLELRKVGPAHTPGDAFVWLPDQRVVFTGDIVYVDRMLGVGPQSDSRTWLEAFAAVAALKPAHVVPGHGGATDLAQAERETRDYLLHLRDKVRAVLDAGGDETAAAGVDQAAFSHLAVFDEISRRNAQQVFMQMEWE